MSTVITHTGTVISAHGNVLVIRLDKDASECTGCAIASMCGQPETLEVPLDTGTDASSMVGRKVALEAFSSSHTLAVILMLVVPVGLLIGVLAWSMHLGCSEMAASLAAIGVTALWYALAWTQRRRLRRRTGFRVIPRPQSDSHTDRHN